MKRIGPYLCLLIALADSALGENAIELGLKGAVSAFTPVPEEKSRPALSTADAILRQYVKKSGENHLCQYSATLSSEWIELNGLKLSRVTYDVVSDADRANGIRERFTVGVECAMHRMRKPGASAWSPWTNGLPLLLPGAIVVELTTNGSWTVKESSLKYFNRIGTSTPATHSPGNGLPPGVSRPKAQAVPKHPSPSNPQSRSPVSTTPRPLSSQTPEQTAQAPIQPPDVPAESQTGTDGKTTDRTPKPFDGIMPLLVVAVVFSSAITLVLKSVSRRNKSGRASPPPLPIQRSDVSPPPLPASSSAPGNNPINLIQRSENLMTPAELAFFAILEPLVRSTCMISSKVRLADLFHVSPGAGQQSAFNKISRKHIDFILTDPATSRILCGIELDDRSHNNPDRVERDNFVNEVFARNQLPLLRVPVAWTYHPQALRAELTKAGLALAT